MTAHYCYLCDDLKDESAFHVNPTTGRNKRCRACVSAKWAGRIEPLVQAKKERDEVWLKNYWWGCPIFTNAVAGEWPANERWRPIENYRGQYDVSDHGRIRSLFYTDRSSGHYYRRVVPEILGLGTHPFGYRTVALVDWHVGIQDHFFVHRLVLETFGERKPSPKMICGHRDGNPSHNHITNLRWVTYAENMEDARQHGTLRVGERSHLSVLTDDIVLAIRREHAIEGLSWYEIAKRRGLKLETVKRAGRGNSWKHLPMPDHSMRLNKYSGAA